MSEWSGKMYDMMYGMFGKYGKSGKNQAVSDMSGRSETIHGMSDI
jgi:hypothetical protein